MKLDLVMYLQSSEYQALDSSFGAQFHSSLQVVAERLKNAKNSYILDCWALTAIDFPLRWQIVTDQSNSPACQV